MTNWDHLFLNKDVNQQVKILTDTLFNVFSNFTPNKVVTFDDRDPPWMTEFIKLKIQQHNSIYKNYHQKNCLDYEILQSEIENVASIISERKSDYYNKLAQKLINPSTGSKTHWSILKTFINGKKIPLIPPLNVVNRFVADFKEKFRLFNEYFASKCTQITIDSSLPRLVVFNSGSSLSAIHFNNDDILKIIRSLNINKAHGHDNISIRMIKI